MTAKQEQLLESKVRKIVKKVMLEENGYEKDYDRKIIKIFQKINGFNEVYTKQLNAKTVTVDDLDNMIATYLGAVGDLRTFREHWDK